MPTPAEPGGNAEQPDFLSFPDHEAVYLGCPYSGCKFVDGEWYFPIATGKYHRFFFQDKVRQVATAASR